jgi:hypothetical protein
MKRFRALLVILSVPILFTVLVGCGGGNTDGSETSNSLPVAIAGSDYSVQVGDSVPFTGIGTDTDGSITNYEWDFDGDGICDWSSKTTGSTNHVYGTTGTYTATLKVTDNAGGTDTDTCTITVSQQAIAHDVRGTWSGNWWRSDGGEEGTLIATLNQSGSVLTGDMTFTSTTYSYSRDTTVSGSVEGSYVVFGMAIGSNGETVTIDYNGTVSEDGNQMMGTYSMSTGYTGSWNVMRMTTLPTITPPTATPTTIPPTTAATPATATPTPTTPTPSETAPPTTTPSLPTIAPTGEDVAVLSSNVFNTTSSVLIDGESRRLHIVAELRNDSSVDMDLGKINIDFYNASGDVVCKRWAYPFDDILPVGGTTVVEETIPSQMYWQNEDNDIPEDWVSYEITIEKKPASGTKRPVEATVQNVEVTVTGTGGLEVTGSVLNSSQETIKNITPYAILYASDGTILNADRDTTITELQSGESQNFMSRFLAGEPIDYAHYVVKAYAEKY